MGRGWAQCGPRAQGGVKAKRQDMCSRWGSTLIEAKPDVGPNEKKTRVAEKRTWLTTMNWLKVKYPLKDLSFFQFYYHIS